MVRACIAAPSHRLQAPHKATSWPAFICPLYTQSLYNMLHGRTTNCQKKEKQTNKNESGLSCKLANSPCKRCWGNASTCHPLIHSTMLNTSKYNWSLVHPYIISLCSPLWFLGGHVRLHQMEYLTQQCNILTQQRTEHSYMPVYCVLFSRGFWWRNVSTLVLEHTSQLGQCRSEKLSSVLQHWDGTF